MPFKKRTFFKSDSDMYNMSSLWFNDFLIENNKTCEKGN